MCRLALYTSLSSYYILLFDSKEKFTDVARGRLCLVLTELLHIRTYSTAQQTKRPAPSILSFGASGREFNVLYLDSLPNLLVWSAPKAIHSDARERSTAFGLAGPFNVGKSPGREKHRWLNHTH